MVGLLNTLAHNLLVWARTWLAETEPRLMRYGLLRLVRDLLGITGTLDFDAAGALTRVTLNRGSPAARLLLGALRQTLAAHAVEVELG